MNNKTVFSSKCTAEILLGLLFQIGDCDMSGQDDEVGVPGGHCGGCFSDKVVDLNSVYARVQIVDILLCYLCLVGNQTRKCL